MAEPLGLLLVMAVMLPVLGATVAPLVGPRWTERLLLALVPAQLAIGVVLAMALLRSGEAVVVHLGGWAPPLGIAFRADGLAVVMLLTTALVLGATALSARAAFGAQPGAAETRAPLAFWTLLLALWAAINAVLVGADLFNLYVALELLTFAAIPLVCLDGRRETLAAALRYLLFALLGSVLYLLGTALLYGAHGTLDIALLSERVRQADPATLAAAALMTAGLLAKTALVPLHLWLPPAHAGAPAAASAVLSALVVKASFVLLLRLWFGALPALLLPSVAQLLAALGTAAVLLGGVVALRQARLKLLVAYSTLAQIGYLFLMVPLVLAGGAGPYGANAWTGGVLQASSHAFAKAAMFLAVGLMAEALGHDRIARLGGAARAAPMAVMAFALAGLSLIGIPPSGGFTAKWLLLTSAIGTGQWWWALVILGGGLLTFGYVSRVLAAALQGGDGARQAPVPRGRQAIPLALALVSVALGLLPLASFGLVQIGRLDLPAGAP
jgi:formate hydrogenlyase subunit 3/multisubunit Na+/H+ antiporter MnhD subunit